MNYAIIILKTQLSWRKKDLKYQEKLTRTGPKIDKLKLDIAQLKQAIKILKKSE